MTIDTELFERALMFGMMKPEILKSSIKDDGIFDALMVLYFGARHSKKLAQEGKMIDSLSDEEHFKVAIPANEANEFRGFLAILMEFLKNYDVQDKSKVKN